MNDLPKKKDFDCIVMKRKIQEKIASETEGLNHEELLHYYKQRVANSRFAGIIKTKEEGLKRSSEQGIK